MLKAIIFDCDGIIANTEPLHFATFRQVLEEHHLHITEEQYYTNYLALDDKSCFRRAFSTRNEALTNDTLEALIARKATYFEPLLSEHLSIFPGVIPFIQAAAQNYPLAIASGARRDEIELILRAGKVREYFQAIISTEDVINSKPHPEAFLKAYEALKKVAEPLLQQGECLVIEDSIYGIKGAQTAGMKCLAVTNTYSREHLTHADFTADSLEGLSLRTLERLFDFT